MGKQPDEDSGLAEQNLNLSPAVSGEAGVDHEPLTVGTERWRALNARRAVLIHKKNRQGLDEPEQVEYEQLQQLIREVIERTFPRPKLSLDQLALIERALGNLETTPESDRSTE